jgi:hypothetical protein
MNAVEIEQAISELAEKPFDRQEFPFQFLEAFGTKNEGGYDAAAQWRASASAIAKGGMRPDGDGAGRPWRH